MIKLGVNIDHIATLRNARGGDEPSILKGAMVVQMAGASQVTVHLREDRRHIKDEDVYLLKSHLAVNLNLEMAATEEMARIAIDLMPNSCCIVPENRKEITTEGGLDVVKFEDKIRRLNTLLHSKGIIVSLFVDADLKQIEAAKRTNADYVELHTGFFADAYHNGNPEEELEKLKQAALLAQSLQMSVNAGHGLNYDNIHLIREINGISEVNIGHSIISRAVFTGLDAAIKDMLHLL